MPLDESIPLLRVRARSQCIEVADASLNLQIEVPVLLSEVAFAYDDSSDRIVIAVVPCPLHLPNSPGVNRWVKRDKTQPDDPQREHLLELSQTQSGANREIWLFILEDAAYSFHLLEWMGSRGAIRTDLCDSYKLERLLGKGAAANVYQGSHLRSESLHDTAAVKVLFDTDGRAEDSLVHEVSMLSKAQGSRHVCRLFSVFGGLVESTPDSVQEGASGESSSATVGRCEYYWALSCELCTCDVYAQIRQHGSLSENATGNHICQTLSGLAYIHRKHIIHRDVKASNILIAQNGLTLLADFGIAALASDTTALACACGTPGFLGPEVLRTKTCDYKTDLFGLGASCFHMLCGRVPFTSPEGVKEILRLNVSCKLPLDVLISSNCSDEAANTSQT
jgi:serine/threonine protein kinase